VIRSVRLWRAVLQRSRADWPVVVAAWLLLLCATTLLATGSLYADTVAAGGVRRSILDQPPDARAIVVRTSVPNAAAAGPLDGPVRTQLARAIERTGGEVAQVIRSGSFADARIDPDAVDQLTELSSYEAIDRHAELVEGSWPVAGTTPIQAVLSRPAAEALGVAVGDRIPLASRLDADLRVEIELTGLFRPDRLDPYWVADPLEVNGIVPGDPYTTVGPVVIAAEDLLGPGLSGRLELQWRGLPAIDQLRVDDVDALRTDIGLLAERLRAAFPEIRQVSIAAPLPGILQDAGRATVVGRSGVTLLTIQFAVLAGYAIVLVGGLLLERRRAETALLRSRGATSFHLLLLSLAEGLALAILAIVPAPWLAVGIVRLLAQLGPLGELGVVTAADVTEATVLVAALTGLAGLLALALPTLGSSVSLTGVRAAIGRQTSRTLPQRLGIDIALVAVAAIAIWQLRLYGAPLTRNARGVLGVDPLLVAAPAIGLLGGAVLALRFVPRAAELAERVLERRRGLVGPLGGRQLARRPLRYTRAALLLMLAAGLGTFATAHAATWTRSQGDQAAYRAATDVRVVPRANRGAPTLLAGSAYRSLPGVTAGMAVTNRTIDLGRNVRGGTLLGLDPVTAARIVAFRAATGSDATDRAALEALAAARPPSPAEPIAGRPARLSVVVDAAISGLDTDGAGLVEVPPDHRPLQASAVLLDADGRLHRATGVAAGRPGGAGQRLEIDLPSGDTGLSPAWPLALVSVELRIVPHAAVALIGTVDLVAVDSSDSAAGDDWRPLVDPATAGWGWSVDGFDGLSPYAPPPGGPARMRFGTEEERRLPPVFPGSPLTFFHAAVSAGMPVQPIVVGRSFLQATGARSGEQVAASTSGVPFDVRIVGVVDDFPPLDPEQPFAIVDAAGYELNRYATTRQIAAADEWWLDVEDGRSGEVAARLAELPFESEAIIDRAAIARSLTTDPVSLGLIGALGLGSVAAMVFAAIGFVVSATVSTSERVGEFALLRALGLSGRQLAVWLSLESAVLLFVGLAAGSALGVLLAWLVLPFATVTETGVPAVPGPIVVVPWQAIAPTVVLAIGLLLVTVFLVRRQVPSVRISGVLRARDE
jgi:hypothetical protein